MPIADKMAAYARFYRFVCSHWLCVNITWAAGISQHTDSKACEETFGNVKLLWCDDVERSLQEKIEAIEVTDFVWGFLARKLFEVDVEPDNCPDWLHWNEHIFEPVIFSQYYMLGYTRIVRLATFYLSPPNIIEILHDKWRPDEEEESESDSENKRLRYRNKKLDKRSCLRKLGLWDEKFGVFEGSDGQVPVSHFSTNLFNMVEWWGVNRITAIAFRLTRILAAIEVSCALASGGNIGSLDGLTSFEDSRFSIQKLRNSFLNVSRNFTTINLNPKSYEVMTTLDMFISVLLLHFVR
jgi:hypothetical protein